MKERERHWSVASHLRPIQGWSPQARYVPWPEWNPQPFGVQDDAPIK